MVLAAAFLLGSHVALRAQRSVSAEDLIHDLDKDLSNLVEKFARTFHHQGEGRLGDNEATALISMSAFAGEMHGLHAVVEHARQAQIVTMLQMMDATLQQADRAVRRAHMAESVKAEWERNVARFEALQQAYGCAPTARVRSRRHGH
jgi:hypothetical protein